MTDLYLTALRRCCAGLAHHALPGLQAQLAYFDRSFLDAMQPQAGQVLPAPA